MVLRVAFLVHMFAIPAFLIFNTDHTGVHFVQHKGTGWHPPGEDDAKVQGFGDMRQFTLLATTSMLGDMAPHQIVFEGSTARCLPQFANVTWRQSSDLGSGTTTKMEKGQEISISKAFKGNMVMDHGGCAGKRVVSYVPVATTSSALPVASSDADEDGQWAPSSLIIEGIGSACATHNHWSNYCTSMAFIKDVFAPYVKAKIEAARAKDPRVCKPFGEQKVLLVFDVWWGWTDAAFRAWLKENYPWIKTGYVPAACTPVGQPMDAGIIAKIKGFLRGCYGRWATRLTILFLGAGNAPSAMKLPLDKQSMVTNLIMWLCRAREHFNGNEAQLQGMRNCWAKTRLPEAMTVRCFTALFDMRT
jgi:hypothetical protein